MQIREGAFRSEGFTLIEALVALVILALLLLGLLAGLLTVIQYNLLNYMRDEAKNLALECAENIRNTPLSSLQAGNVVCNSQNFVNVDTPCTNVGAMVSAGTAERIRRQVRNTYVDYSIGWNLQQVGDVMQVQIQVCWNYRNRSYTHTITTVVGGS